MAKRVLVFGSSGQDGPYLRAAAVRRGWEVIGVSRHSSHDAGDVADFDYVADLVRRVEPDLVFHFAAESSTRHEAWEQNHAAISWGARNLCEAAMLYRPEARVFVVGSGLQFANDGTPIDEGAPFEPSSPYAIERIAAVHTARYYRQRGLRTYVGYLFHHDSPLRPDRHLSMRIVRAAHAAAEGSKAVLELASTEAEKEWGHARDIVEGMLALVTQDAVAEAVIGTGRAHTVATWCDLCFSRVGLDWRRYVRERAESVPFERLVSNPATMTALGWESSCALVDLCEEMMAVDCALPSAVSRAHATTPS